MNFPKSIRDIAEAASRDHPNDVAAAVVVAMERITALPEYPSLAEAFFRKAVKDLVYAARHATNVKIKNQTGYYGRSPGTVVNGISAVILDIYESVYNYRIAGTTLGLLRGKDLLAIARTEHLKAEGYIFNSRLCHWLSSRVHGEEEVRSKIPEAELRKKFSQLYREVYGSGDGSAA